MLGRTLVLRSLAYYRSAHAAVVLGVAVAVAVLSGALLVGESLRGSLRQQVLRRLGRADHAVVASRFFREDLAREIAQAGVEAAAPALAHAGMVTAPESGRRAGEVDVWGVDERFWVFHGRPAPALGPRDALVSPALAGELGVGAGATVLLRVRAHADVSGSSLFGRRDDPAKAIRLTVRAVAGSDDLGEFSLRPRQQPLKVIFVPLALLQRTLGRPNRANVVLITADPAAPEGARAAVARATQLEDMGLRVRTPAAGGPLALQTDGAYLSDAEAEAARAAAGEAGLEATGVLVHLADAIRVGERSIPYSTVAGLEQGPWADAASVDGASPPIVLNEWAARELGARTGDAVALDYSVWLEAGRIENRSAAFRLAAVVPISATDRDLVPNYPGITETAHMADWDPPFPVDLAKIRPADEAYWDAHRATPKGFVPLAVAQQLWGHREGKLTTLRLKPPAGAAMEPAAAAFARALRGRLDLEAEALEVLPVRALGLTAARGSTEFGQYFLYFSAFLVAAALLLAGLFFRLGIEQRLVEIGLLRATGFGEAQVGRLLLAEGIVTSTLGALLGIAGAAVWASLLLFGLRTVWHGATGTREIALHVAAWPLVAGALGGLGAAAFTILLTLRGLRQYTPRALLKGSRSDGAAGVPARLRRVAWALGLLAALLLAAAAIGWMGATPAFFAAGALVLAALLTALRSALGGRPPWARGFAGPGDLGLRGPGFRPGRSVVSVALLASATFLVVAVGAFRHGSGAVERDPRSAGGGYTLVATSLVPLHHDLGTHEGREELGLSEAALADARVDRFRRRDGDDASCLNLYAPQNPTILAPSPEFVAAGRFAFQSSLATTPEQKANPWLLLDADAAGAIPVVADANSMQYVLKKSLGDTMPLAGTGINVRFVAALSPGLFQGELLMGERGFLRAFPEESGYRFFLIDTPASPDATAATLESGLGDFGFDATSVEERLAAYHRVENAYIATFQTLGGLALVLGTFGLAAVLVRNALEQRREMALLRAVGFRRRDLVVQVAAENALLLALGLGIGSLAAGLAISPALAERGGALPVGGLLALLGGMVAAGLVTTQAAVAAVSRLPVLESLRSE